jgi:SnoaL-like protein
MAGPVPIFAFLKKANGAGDRIVQVLPRPEARRRGGRASITRPVTRIRWLLQENDVSNANIRAALDRHWAASNANDFEAEHDIYREDALLHYPQSGEHIRGRRNIQAARAAQPNRKRFTVQRITGAGNLWVTEYLLTYDGRPSYTVSIMEFVDGKVARETQYFGDPFEPGPSRAQWVEQVS